MEEAMPKVCRSLSVRFVLLSCVLAFASLLGAPASLLAQSGLAGRWEGGITLPPGPLQIVVEFKQADSGWQGTIDIPQQGARGLPLQTVRFDASQVHFELQAGPGLAVFDGKLEGNKISGNFSQADQTFPFALERKVQAAAPAKQLPEGMIPREVLFGNPEKTSPQLSPDGTRLGYLAPSNGVLNVWVRTVGKTDDQVITSDKKRGIRFFGWQFDGDHILYIQDKDGDENWPGISDLSFAFA
jgi:hypothetical protein